MSIAEAEVDSLVDGFALAAFEGNAAWFIGAGVSKPSGLPEWSELLRPFARQLGINLNQHDDLPAIAQYCINKASGNRGPLVQQLRQALGRSVTPSHYHYQIARSSVSTVWTTNYDDLMEHALTGLKYRVRVRESDFVELTDAATIELIKAHGSLGISSAREFVISSEDFEDYADRRPAMTARLRSDLLTKSFLFVGYGYGDPNIRTVLVEARRVAEGATLPHWMLVKAIDPADAELMRRQELWKSDLERIGIRCVLVPTYDDIEKTVVRIARRSRGPTIYVTGSHSGDDPRAAEMGQLLADPTRAPTILLDGQSTGVSRTLLTAFQSAAVMQRVDLNKRLRFYPNPYAADPKFSSDPSLLPMLKQWRGSMLRQAHSILVFDGGMGTQAEIEIAMELGCFIVPVTNDPKGSACLLLDNPTIAAELDKRAPGYVTKAKALNLIPKDVVDCLLSEIPSWPR